MPRGVVALVLAGTLASAAGASTLLVPKPTRYAVAPDPTCHTTTEHVLKGTTWTTRRAIAPGHAGLRATAIAPRTIRVDWSLASPARCATALLMVTAGKYGERWEPTNVSVIPHGRTHGSVTVKVIAVLPPPDVVVGSAFSATDVEDVKHGESAVLIRP